MTATGHALVSTLIVAKIPNPYISLPLCLLSHFALDMVPHWDAGTHRHHITKKRLFYEAATDVIIGFLASYILYHDVLLQTNYILLVSGIIMGQLPDWITAPYLMMAHSNHITRLSKHVYKVQHALNKRIESPIWGIVTQAITVIVVYIVLFRLF